MEIDCKESDWVDVLFFDTLLQYYLCIAPEDLPDEVWALKIRHLQDIREKEASANNTR